MKKESVRTKRAYYHRLFLNNDGTPKPDALSVLLELRKFCQVEKNPLVLSNDLKTDIPASFYQRGVKDVYDHIIQLLELDPLARVSEHQKEKDANDRPDTAKQ